MGMQVKAVFQSIPVNTVELVSAPQENTDQVDAVPSQ